jgi:hypothetical protein
VNERQAYALTHPISDASNVADAAGRIRSQRAGDLLIQSILAVDR